MNDEKKVKASGGGTQVAYIILKKNVLKRKLFRFGKFSKQKKNRG